MGLVVRLGYDRRMLGNHAHQLQHNKIIDYEMGNLSIYVLPLCTEHNASEKQCQFSNELNSMQLNFAFANNLPVYCTLTS